MKLIRTLIKNFKLLARSKGSALVVLFAPLLIVLIIGVSFTDETKTTLNIGVKTFDEGELTQRYLSRLNTTGNNILEFDTQEQCISSTKEGLTVACVIFPENFILENNKTNEIKFYVDNTRTNFVYQLISDLSFNIGNESQEVSKELAGDLLGIVSIASTEASESLESLQKNEDLVKNSEAILASSKSSLNELDVDEATVTLDDAPEVAGIVADEFSGLEADAQSVLTKGYSLVSEIESNGYVLTEKDSFKSRLANLNTTLTDIANSTADADDLYQKLTDVEQELEDLQDRLDDAGNIKSDVLSDVSSLLSNLAEIKSNTNSVISRQQNILNNIDAFNFTTSGSIVNPVSTQIEKLSSKNNRTTYAFPYLLMLVILFVGMMLSSTLVFIEKDSRASFRNFTTPTRDSHFVFSTYLTALIIILIQVIAILTLAYFGLGVPVLANLGMSAAVIFLGITMAVTLGMLIGHTFSTSEGMTMTSIGIGSVLIFLSNLILPLETLAETIQSIAKYNPYVIASEGIRKAMLFNAQIDKLYLELIILAGISLILLTVTVIIIKTTSINRIRTKRKQQGRVIITVSEEQALILESKNIAIRNIMDLLEALRLIDDSDYKTFTKPNNVFYNWLKNELKDNYLARKLKRRSRMSAIKFLEKYTQK